MAEEEWTSLSVKEKIVHSSWKARCDGYDLLSKDFVLMDSGKEFSTYLEMMKKVPLESNAATLEKALDCLLTFIDSNGKVASQIAPDIVANIVLKVFTARPKAKQSAQDICLLLIENENQEIVIEELLKGLQNKNPKVVNGSLDFVLISLKEFGAKVINIKAIMGNLQKVFEHTDKGVREKGKLISIEIYQWVKDAVLSSISNIQPVILKELQEEFEKYKTSGAPKVTRKLKSSQDTNANNEVGVEEQEPEKEIDPFDFVEAVNVVNNLPNNFYENVNAAKWQERKEALEQLFKLVNVPKVANGNFNELFNCLKKIISTDKNVNVVFTAINCVYAIGNAIRSDVAIYVSILLPCLLEKFKEKKANVVSALREAGFSTVKYVKVEELLEIIQIYFEDNNPSVRDETIKIFIKYIEFQGKNISKPTLKVVSNLLIKKMDDGAGPVRESTSEALAILMKVVGEKTMNIFLDPLNDIKKNKIKDYYNKLIGEKVIDAEPSKIVTSKPVLPLPSKVPNNNVEIETKNLPENSLKQVMTEDPIINIPAKSTPVKGKNNVVDYSIDEKDPNEPDISEDAAIENIANIISETHINNLSVTDWKIRLETVEAIQDIINKNPNLSPLVLFKVLGKKPGWKDGNIQVLKAKMSLICSMLENGSAPSFRTVEGLGLIAFEKIGDNKLSESSKITLNSLIKVSSINFIGIRALSYIKTTKSVKAQSELLTLISENLMETGLKIDLKKYIECILFVLESKNPDVKKSALNLAGVIYIFYGKNAKNLFVTDKTNISQLLDAEFEKCKDKKPPVLSSQTENVEEEANDVQDDELLESLIERKDILPLINDSIYSQLNDKNWKVRNEALDNLKDIFEKNKHIKPDGLEKLFNAILERTSDNNKNLLILALNLLSIIIQACGKGVGKYKDMLLRRCIVTFNDSKIQVRNGVSAILDSWNKVVPLKETFYVGKDMPNFVLDSLNSENSFQRSELLKWIEICFSDVKKAKTVETAFIETWLNAYFNCLSDKSPDTRKNVQTLFPVLTGLIGKNVMKKYVMQIKDEGSRKTLLESLNQVKEEVKTQEVKQIVVEQTITNKTYIEEPVVQEKPEPPKKQIIILYKQDSKEARAKEESTVINVQWNFTAVKPEHKNFLKEQMAPYFSTTLMNDLFHSDFKKQIEGIQFITQLVVDKVDMMGIIECYDLMLKYIVLKFFETNTSVHLKCFEFLDKTLDLFVAENKNLSFYEIDIFIKYLIIRFGDSKDPIRKASKMIFEKICKLYPIEKLLPYLCDSLVTKNSRIRSETIDQIYLCINWLKVESMDKQILIGLLNEVSKYVCDKDVATKKNALNCLTVVFICYGPDETKKYLSSAYKNISKREQDAIEERFKYSINDHTKYLEEKKRLLILEQERMEKERIEQERMEKERIEQELMEKERIERERIEQESMEKERIEKESMGHEELNDQNILNDKELMNETFVINKSVPEVFKLDIASLVKALPKIAPLDKPKTIEIDYTFLENDFIFDFSPKQEVTLKESSVFKDFDILKNQVLNLDTNNQNITELLTRCDDMLTGDTRLSLQKQFYIVMLEKFSRYIEIIEDPSGGLFRKIIVGLNFIFFSSYNESNLKPVVECLLNITSHYKKIKRPEFRPNTRLINQLMSNILNICPIPVSLNLLYLMAENSVKNNDKFIMGLILKCFWKCCHNYNSPIYKAIINKNENEDLIIILK